MTLTALTVDCLQNGRKLAFYTIIMQFVILMKDFTAEQCDTRGDVCYYSGV